MYLTVCPLCRPGHDSSGPSGSMNGISLSVHSVARVMIAQASVGA